MRGMENNLAQLFSLMTRPFGSFIQVGHSLPLTKLNFCHGFQNGEYGTCISEIINSLPKGKISDKFKLKAFADDKINVTQNCHLF